MDSESRCSECGLSVHHEHHQPFHQIVTWNKYMFEVARQKEMDKFEKRLPKKDPRNQSGSSTLL